MESEEQQEVVGPTGSAWSLGEIPASAWFVLLYLGLVILVATHTMSRTTAVLLGVLVPSIILHEISHGFVANLCGDDTAKRMGRLTLNPIAHVDPVGTIIMPAILMLTTGAGFGFAKPVPIDLSKTRKPRNHSVLISLAGPSMNFLLVALALLISRIADVPAKSMFVLSFATMPLWMLVLYAVGMMNLWLGLFNLLPIPPLDGSVLIERFLPDRHLPTYFKLRSISIIAVFMVVFVFRGPVNALASHLEHWWAQLFFG